MTRLGEGGGNLQTAIYRPGNDTGHGSCVSIFGNVGAKLSAVTGRQTAVYGAVSCVLFLVLLVEKIAWATKECKWKVNGILVYII
jgi:hypothetical protein